VPATKESQGSDTSTNAVTSYPNIGTRVASSGVERSEGKLTGGIAVLGRQVTD
jgi:hypothetical protein